MTGYAKWAKLAGLPQDPRDLLDLLITVDRLVMPVLRMSQPLLPSRSYSDYVTGFNITADGICLFMAGEGDIGGEFPYLAFDGKGWAWTEWYDMDRGAGWMRGYPCRVTFSAPARPPAPAAPDGKIPQLVPRLTPYFLVMLLAASLVLLYLSH